MHDLRLAIRELRRTPLVTGVAILSLALGIGGTTAIFSLINSLLVRPLPILEPHRLAVLSDTRAGFTQTWTYGVWSQVREHAQLFDGACAAWLDRLNLGLHGGEAEPVDALWVSGEYFKTLGVSTLLGRVITEQDDRREGGQHDAVAVISYELWQRRFGGAANVIGMPLIIERVPFTIVGVTPPASSGLKSVEHSTSPCP